jgi:hypothetical protein
VKVSTVAITRHPALTCQNFIGPSRMFAVRTAANSFYLILSRRLYFSFTQFKQGIS